MSKHNHEMWEKSGTKRHPTQKNTHTIQNNWQQQQQLNKSSLNLVKINRCSSVAYTFSRKYNHHVKPKQNGFASFGCLSQCTWTTINFVFFFARPLDHSTSIAMIFCVNDIRLLLCFYSPFRFVRSRTLSVIDY